MRGGRERELKDEIKFHTFLITYFYCIVLYVYEVNYKVLEYFRLTNTVVQSRIYILCIVYCLGLVVCSVREQKPR